MPASPKPDPLSEQSSEIRSFLRDFDKLYARVFLDRADMTRSDALMVYMLMRLEESIDALATLFTPREDDTDQPWKRRDDD